MFQQPCWVFNNLQFRDCTYSVPFVHLHRKLYYTKRILNIKNVSSPYSFRSRYPPSLVQYIYGVLRSRRPLKRVKNISFIVCLNHCKSSTPFRTTLKYKISFDNPVRHFWSWVTSVRMGRFLQALRINANAPTRAKNTAAQITNDKWRRCWVNYEQDRWYGWGRERTVKLLLQSNHTGLPNVVNSKLRPRNYHVRRQHYTQKHNSWIRKSKPQLCQKE
jgi:hypothetical protein